MINGFFKSAPYLLSAFIGLIFFWEYQDSKNYVEFEVGTDTGLIAYSHDCGATWKQFKPADFKFVSLWDLYKVKVKRLNSNCVVLFDDVGSKTHSKEMTVKFKDGLDAKVDVGIAFVIVDQIKYLRESVNSKYADDDRKWAYYVNTPYYAYNEQIESALVNAIKEVGENNELVNTTEGEFAELVGRSENLRKTLAVYGLGVDRGHYSWSRIEITKHSNMLFQARMAACNRAGNAVHEGHKTKI
ncbi:MAG: hypothetical protein ACTS9Y_00445 [Methylophilus sp.]|uniref:hypothetical protein n=1 Tax=Methylophilus sp. TaxID=29541 RepID=UPI003F9EF167